MTSKSSALKVTIPASSTTSNEIFIPNSSVVGVKFPAAMTGTAITFSSAFNQEDTKVPHYTKAGSALTVTKVNSTIVQIDANDTSALGYYITVVSNGTEASERTFHLIVRDLS